MRLAVVSDIHGSLTALEAVVSDLDRQSPDVVVHGGDLALMGPQPAEVVDRIRELGWSGVVGNTDELLWRPEVCSEQESRAPKLHSLLRVIFEEYRPATNELLGDERVEGLKQLPAQLELDDVVLVHASPGDLWRAPLPEADDAELLDTYGQSGTRIAYGHIHRPYVRRPAGMIVANAGSVGLPWDGDPRASYLLIEDGAPRVIRVEYDIETERRLLLASGYPDAERLAEMRTLGRFVPVR
jgi:putative phosphoesterase